jgi:4-alpha-glucanotransferase
MARHAGVTAPLFSIVSSRSWGIGEFADLEPFARWLQSGGFDRLMLLPVGAVSPGETSPYSAASAMAFDSIYVAVHGIPEFLAAGGEEAMPDAARTALASARRAASISYADVRLAKRAALDMAAARFAAGTGTAGGRRERFETFAAREAWWLEDYVLFLALSREQQRPWWEWDAALRQRAPQAIAEARHRLAGPIARHRYVQWVADEQWRDAHGAAARHGVTLLGDLPFTVGAHSSDVWARQDVFRLDISTGAPPDAFSATGQNWHLPFFDWPALERTGYDWIVARARRMAALFDGVRIDHLVGLYRTYGIPREGEPFFSPADEGAQVRQGEAILRLFLDAGLTVIAEDLGTVPDFVRDSMARLGVPGSKVMRWERDWHAEGQPFLDPASFPAVSAAMTGTHDTEPIALWWESMTPGDRAAMAALPKLRAHGISADDPWSASVRDAILDAAFESGSDDLILPIGDVFGWRDRINTPATIGPHNWTWRLPWPADTLGAQPEAIERAAFCLRRAVASSRTDDVPATPDQ